MDRFIDASPSHGKTKESLMYPRKFCESRCQVPQETDDSIGPCKAIERTACASAFTGGPQISGRTRTEIPIHTAPGPIRSGDHMSRSNKRGGFFQIRTAVRISLTSFLLLSGPVIHAWPFGSPGRRPLTTRTNCPSCSGTGVVTGRCSPCRGTGNRMSGIFNPVSCVSCNGTGSVSMRCHGCGGSGRVLRAE